MIKCTFLLPGLSIYTSLIQVEMIFTIVCRCIYKLTKINFVKDNALMAISKLNATDDNFTFSEGKFFGFKDKIRKWCKGSTLCILFVG